MIKMGQKKRGDIIVQDRITCSAAPERKKGKRREQPEKNPDLGEGGKRVRTVLHGRNFPDLPCGEITIEGNSIVKHCTTAATKKSPRINMGVKQKNIISAKSQQERRK
jgi:hypothetical protein